MRKPRAEKVQCQRTVFPYPTLGRSRNCLHPAGPSGYCKQHNPDRIAARRAERRIEMIAAWAIAVAEGDRLAAIADADALIARGIPEDKARIAAGLPCVADATVTGGLDARILAAWLGRRSVPEPNTGCWLWEGALSTCGYAQAHVRGRTWLVSRLVLGLMDSQTYACHRCDTPSCVNPDHLYPGTNSDNQGDSIRRGRHANARKTRCAKGHPLIGENVYQFGRWRQCRTCRMARGAAHTRAYRARQQAKRLARV